MSGEELETPGGDAEASPGEVLAAAREAVGVTHLEVAEALNLPIRTVEAIENNDQERLPAHVFTRGYVRAYAKLLEIDPEPLLAAMRHSEQEPVQSHEATAKTQSRSPFRLGIDPIGSVSPKAGINLQHLTYIGVGIAVLFLLVVVYFSSDGADEPSQEVSSKTATIGTPTNAPPTNGRPSNGAPSNGALTIGVADEAGPAIDSPRSSGVALPIAGSSVNARVQVPAVETREIAVARVAGADEITPASQSRDEPRRLTPSGGDRLTLSFSEDCWVEISEPDGIKLFTDLGRAGQTLSFVGAGPFRVRLGYAPGVELAYNAEVVALAAHTSRDIANLVVGR